MPIHAPGRRDRNNRLNRGTGRKIAAFLSLTAMVDMFSVLTVFLLNYNTTGELVDVPKDVRLPPAAETKELKPAHIVVISQNEVILDKQRVATLNEVKAQSDWMIPKLYQVLRVEIEKDKIKAREGLRDALRTAVKGPVPAPQTKQGDERWRKISIQADKEVDMLTLKKVMFTVTQAGGQEINFAVTKQSVEEMGLVVRPGG